MRILIWHLHGSWMTSFVQGQHDYLVPVLPERGPFGLGRARTWDWPSSVREVTPGQLRGEHVDVVVAQRPGELTLAASWLGRGPGRTCPPSTLSTTLRPGRPSAPGIRWLTCPGC